MKTLRKQYLNCVDINDLLTVVLQDLLSNTFSRLIVKLRMLLLLMFLLGLIAGFLMR